MIIAIYQYVSNQIVLQMELKLWQTQIKAILCISAHNVEIPSFAFQFDTKT